MKLKWSSLLTGMVLGSIGTAAVGTAAVASADGFQVSLADVKLLINGMDKTNGGSFFNGETNVPVALTFGDSTYVPLRYVSQALGYAVNWDQNSKTITIGTGGPTAASTSFGTNQKFVPPGRQGLGDIAYLSSDVYSGTDSDLLVVKLAYENADKNTWNFGNYALSFQRSDGSTYAAASNLPQGSEANVDPKTSRVVVYSASVPKGSKASDYKMLLSSYDFSQQPAVVSQLAAAQLTDSTTNANLYNAGDTASVSLAPYSLSFTSTQNLGASRGQGTQSYQANISYSKPGGAVSYAEDGNVEFDLMEQGRVVSSAKYAMGTSSSLPQLPTGDTSLSFSNVTWNSTDTSAPVVFMYAVYQGDKKLLGTYTMPLNSDSSSKTTPPALGTGNAPTYLVNQKFVPAGRNGLGDIYLLSSDVYSGADTDQLVVKIAYENTDTIAWNFSNYTVGFQRFDGSVYTPTSNIPQGTAASVDPKTTRVVTYTASVPKGSKTSDYTSFVNYQLSQQPAIASRQVNFALQDTALAPSVFYPTDTAVLNVAPYTLNISNYINMGKPGSSQIQSYRFNMTFSKPEGDVSYPDDGDLEFDLMDTQGRVVSSLKYTMGSSASTTFQTLPNGDTILSFPGVNWANFDNLNPYINIYSYSQGAKKLIGTLKTP